MVLEHVNFGPKGLKVFAVDPGVVQTDIRGTSREAREAGGLAISPSIPAELVFSVIRGERDEDVGRMISADRVQPWRDGKTMGQGSKGVVGRCTYSSLHQRVYYASSRPKKRTSST